MSVSVTEYRNLFADVVVSCRQKLLDWSLQFLKEHKLVTSSYSTPVNFSRASGFALEVRKVVALVFRFLKAKVPWTADCVADVEFSLTSHAIIIPLIAKTEVVNRYVVKLGRELAAVGFSPYNVAVTPRHDVLVFQGYTALGKCHQIVITFSEPVSSGKVLYNPYRLLFLYPSLLDVLISTAKYRPVLRELPPLEGELLPTMVIGPKYVR